MKPIDNICILCYKEKGKKNIKKDEVFYVKRGEITIAELNMQ